MDIQTNGGRMTMTKKYKIPELDEGHLHKDSLTNIIGLKDMRQKFRITHDSAK